MVRNETRYRGTVWIDATTFQRVKLQATQTALSAPVVSNEEVIELAVVGRMKDREIVLPVESVSQQIVLIAGRNILVEKSSSFSNYELNPSDFSARRVEARRGERIMYRDTDRGVRYYVKEGDARVVSERATTQGQGDGDRDPRSIRRLAIRCRCSASTSGTSSSAASGLTARDALCRRARARQRPAAQAAGVPPLDGSVDFFAIAVPSSDKVYDAAGEREGERVLTWPLSAGANLGYQFTSFQKLSAQYQFRFDGYLHDRTTSESYVTPASTTTHGFGAGYELSARGLFNRGERHPVRGARAGGPGDPSDAIVTSPQTYRTRTASA